MATSFANFSASEPEPTVAQDYQDLKSTDMAEEGRKHFGRGLPPPQSALDRICPTSRLLLLVAGLCAVLSLLVIIMGTKGAQFGTAQQETWESLQSFNKTVSVGLSSLQQKRNSTSSRLTTLEQTLGREGNETEKIKKRLESLLAILHQDSNSLRCQLVELQSNGTEETKEAGGETNWRPWMEAKRDCEGKESHLIIINSPEEKKFVDELRRSAYMWIGLTDVSGTWKWVDETGYTVRSEDWGEGQPDHWYGHTLGGGEDCVHTYPDGRWNDNHCSRSFAWMCEKELKV
uniref:Uncharacterized protein n=1 Tax=Sphaerodactylus townsendi TaxID=933632 RepID=A0ACB8EWP9_9SAUR